MDEDTRIFAMELRYEQDIVLVRQVARRAAGLLGFDVHDQTRIATAISEVARGVFREGGRIQAQFSVTRESESSFLVQVSTLGGMQPGGAPLHESGAGASLGIASARRLMDDSYVNSVPNKGVEVILRKRLPRKGTQLTSEMLRSIGRDLMHKAESQTAFEEVRHQNIELMSVLEKLREREAELAQMNRELEETNRGIIALYAELDEKAASLQRANEVKTRFLSHMTHEFRTPLSSVLSLTRMLLEDDEERLTSEQEVQVKYIRQAITELSEMVNDLLDLAKVGAGKLSVRMERCELADLLAALRGMFRPMVPEGGPVRLVLDEPVGIPPIWTDEAKLSQILRNLISNALKFTPKGEVRVAATRMGEDHVGILVADTGIGIAAEEQERIFEEFAQVESHVQKATKGTGLGLPLSRQLAEILGGHLRVESALGHGSTFTLVLPIRNETSRSDEAPPEKQAKALERRPGSPGSELPASNRILIIDDDATSRYLLSERLRREGCPVLEAASGREGLTLAQRHHPTAVFLDLRMPGLDGFQVLDALKSEPSTRNIPVIIHTSVPLEGETLARLGSRVVAALSKDDSNGGAWERVRELLKNSGTTRLR